VRGYFLWFRDISGRMELGDITMGTFVLVLVLSGQLISDTPAPQVTAVTIPGYASYDACRKAGAAAARKQTVRSVRNFFCIPGPGVAEVAKQG
jgi:hypothetical protein